MHVHLSYAHTTNLMNSIWTWVRLVTCSTLPKHQQDASWPTKPSLEIHPHLIVEKFFGEIVHQTFGSSVDDFLVDIEYKHQTSWCHPTFIQQAKYPLGNGFHPFFKKFTYPFSTLFIHYPHFFFLFSLHLFLFCDEICYHLPCDLRPHGTWKINDHATPQHSQGLGAKYPPSFEWLV